jgi:hypothetical protein
MAITEGTLESSSRLNIAWLNSPQPTEATQAFSARGYSVETCDSEALGRPAFLAGLAAVVFTQNPDKLRDIGSDIEAHGARILDHGCQILAIPARGWHSSLIESIEKTRLSTVASLNILSFPFIRIFDEKADWNAIASFIEKHPQGRPPNAQLQIDSDVGKTGNIPGLSSARIVLLQRAFGDCSKVHLKPLGGGLSGAAVFIAYPTLERTYLNSRLPLPYFVKFDSRDNALKEYKNYRERVDPFIPFHLGPHLIDERCFLGAFDGVIVGDYVEESESLIDCAKSGRAGPAIACLFNRTVHGWHRDATEQNGATYPIFPDSIPAARWNLAKSLGAKTVLKDLRQYLKHANISSMMVGPVHGDLNANNVRVRGVDAIVIDFLSQRDDGDVVFDAANLEASLLVDGFANNLLGQRASANDVRTTLKLVRPIYEKSLVNLVPPYCDPENPANWFYECVRQIRRYARQVECHSGQYATALARAFLKRSCKESRADAPFTINEEYRRSAAYVVAELILLRTFGPNSGRRQQSRVVQ